MKMKRKIRGDRLKAIELLLMHLEEVGTEYIFGIPGGVMEPLNKAVYHNDNIEGVVTCHEEGAAFMADGYARVGKKLGVCCCTAGPGATNLLTGIASSFADSVPVMALTAQVSTKNFGKGAFQESSYEGINIVEMFRSITKYSSMIVNPESTPIIIRKAIRKALSGRPGPVHLNLPIDVMEKTIDFDLVSSENVIRKSTSFDREQMKEAASLLLEFERPAIILGNGVTISRAAHDIVGLAESLQIPVATTPKAKGVFPENHPLSLGVFGTAGSPLSEAYLLGQKKIDGLFAIGTSFNEWGTHTWDKRLMPERALIHLNVDQGEIGNVYPAAVALEGDAKAVVSELVFEIKRRSEKGGPSMAELIARRGKEFLAFKEGISRYDGIEKLDSESVPILPQRLIKDIEKACPDDTIYFVDIGNNWAWATHYLEIKRPYSFFTGLGFASMGYGVAASIGGKFAAPDRPVVAIVGDGGFLMNGTEVATAVNYNKQVIWVILNDSGHGMIHHGKRMLGTPGGFATRFRQVDFVKMAEALGAQGIRITKPGEINKKLIDKIIASGRPTVIDVIIDQEEAPPINSRISSIESTYT